MYKQTQHWVNAWLWLRLINLSEIFFHAKKWLKEQNLLSHKILKCLEFVREKTQFISDEIAVSSNILLKQILIWKLKEK